ncbi:MAG: hypothetical protein OXN90_20385 [Gemmatimonadota bacterium]|nr:hypothetical protein [Gemmatimonadota bacterium]
MPDSKVAKYSKGGIEVDLEEVTQKGRSFEIKVSVGKLWFPSEEAAVRFFSEIIEKIKNTS